MTIETVAEYESTWRTWRVLATKAKARGEELGDEAKAMRAELTRFEKQKGWV